MTSSLSPSTLEPLLALARQAASLAAQNLAERWDEPRDIHIKSDESLVTQIDTQNEKLLVDFFATHTPDYGFLGEEGGIHEAQKSGQPYWYVDPVDGTSNMAHGFPWSCISIGLVVEGQPVVGVVNNPIQNHEFYGAQGLGAWLNGRRLHVSRNADFARALLATGFPVGPHADRFPNLDNFGRVSRAVHSVRRPGSAALDLCCVGAGWFDGCWEINLKPWDTAAGVILVREAGGTVTGFEGDAYDPHVPYIIATNAQFHAPLQALLLKRG